MHLNFVTMAWSTKSATGVALMVVIGCVQAPRAPYPSGIARVDGKKEGLARLGLPDGGEKIGAYKNDLKDGPWVQRTADGDTSFLAHYAQGRAHGRWETFKDGGPTLFTTYRHGVEQGPRITWHKGGWPASLTCFSQGEPHGIAHRWNRADTVNIGRHVVGSYTHGKIDGTWRRYYADGALCNENNYRNGLRHGTWRLWARDGTLLRENEYRNDRLIRTVVDRLK